MNQRKAHLLVAGAVALGTLIAGCASTPQPNAALESARLAVAAARQDANAMQSAPREVDAAKAALDRADNAWRNRESDQVITHHAELAKTRAQTAVELGRWRAAEKEVTSSRSERDRLVLSKRTNEAQDARRDAAAAQIRASAESQRADAMEKAAASAASTARAEADRAASLEQKLAGLLVQQTSRGLTVTLKDVLFETGRATLLPGAQRTVERLAEVLNDEPTRRIRIEGFTDSRGGEQYNLDLAQRRANAVRDALVSRGVNSERVEVLAFGKAYPLASNATPEGRQQNRRVEIVFSDQQGRISSR